MSVKPVASVTLSVKGVASVIVSVKTVSSVIVSVKTVSVTVSVKTVTSVTLSVIYRECQWNTAGVSLSLCCIDSVSGDVTPSKRWSNVTGQ